MTVRGRVSRLFGPWVVSALGVALLGVPLYDMYEDAYVPPQKSLHSTVVENSVLILLALCIAAAGVWLARQPWSDDRKRSVVRWTVAGAAAVGLVFGWILGVQYFAQHDLKPVIIAMDAVVVGSLATFGVGVYHSREQQRREELAESEQRYRSLIEDVLDSQEVAQLIVGDDGRVVWANAAIEEYFGLDRDAVVGRDRLDLLGERADLFTVPGDGDFGRLLRDAYDEDEVCEFEFRMDPGVRGDAAGDAVADGGVDLADAPSDAKWFEHWSKPIETGLYAGGRVERYVDITDQKRRERELERRESMLRELYDVISAKDREFDWKVRELLEIGERLLDTEVSAFATVDGDDFRFEVVRAGGDVDEDAVLPLAETHCAETVASDGAMRFDAPAKLSEHDGGDIESYLGAPVTVSGELYGTVCFIAPGERRDFENWELTMVDLMASWLGYELERRQREQQREAELREQRSVYTSVVEAVTEYAIFTLDEDGRVTSWNEGARRLKGYDEEEVLGEHLSTFYPPEYREQGRAETLLGTAAENGHAEDEGWRVRKDGSRFWANVDLTARYDDDGDLVGYTKITRDMTERREREQALTEQREQLEFMNRILRHNLLNGLNVVNARADILGGHVDDDYEEHLDTVTQRVDDMADLIETMRSFVETVVEGDERELEAVGLRDVLASEVEKTRTGYDDVDVSFDEPPDVAVLADDLLGEVFENVLTNAVVHNDADVAEIDVSVDVDPETVRVHVGDNGPGIPDDEKREVVEKGVKGLQSPGSGFGLYLVKELLEAYGGDVDIADNDPRGTVVTVTLRRADEEPTRESEDGSAAGGSPDADADADPDGDGDPDAAGESTAGSAPESGAESA
ncbi:PAS domain S-box protein [Halobaculum sp. D14]|uniref:PAS domain S-box protein n=1 Tax=Halobaculum sp. D14 TaxID=3421642 RepID=UPI003EBD2B8B